MTNTTLRQIRVVQIFPRTEPDQYSPLTGQAGHENARGILGTATVEADGSARFLMPAERPILFQILDQDGEGTGLGVVGDLPEPISAEEAVALVKDRFSLKAMRTSKPLEGKISRVAMCGGSGGSLISAAARSGAQLYISGDISYHNFFTKEGFMIMDIGHYESEIEIVDILFSLLKKNFPTFAVRITQNIYNNPIFYF
jgi:putative NIF3 family GTP cyclohydrolase 1 type 2